MIDRQTIDKIMSAVQIVDVIGDFVSLKKKGANHIGCCPFHEEKTPSFYVSPSKGIYKCFGCGEHGNAIGFLMKHESYNYPEALRYLAKKYNIDIVEEKLSEEQQALQNERDGLFHVSKFAQEYFASLLYNNELGKAVGLSYFYSRGMSDEVIKKFGLGYCLDEWSNFTDYALNNQYSIEVLDKTGLTIVNKETGRRYDRFRGRVMFPIYSISGRVLGFSGRILSKEKAIAKYVNSPESEIYTKGNILYGLYQARGAIGKHDKCYLVEGNIDVISMHQSGVENTVASCGTALTTNQIRLIKRFTSNVTVVYDGDSAGIKATLKAVNLLFAEGIHVRMVLFPDNDDPDSYAQKYGSTKLQEYLANHEENFLLYRARLAGEEIKKDPLKKADFIKEIINSIALVVDPMERTEYITQCAYIFNTNEDILTQQVAKVAASMRAQVAKEAAQAERRIAEQENANNSQPSAQAQTQPAQQTIDRQDEEEPFPFPDNTNTPPPAYSQPVNTAPQQILPDLYPCEAQERQIAKLLVCDGATMITIPGVDENEEEVMYEIGVAEFIISEIQNDDLTFDNPTFKSIFDLYAEKIQKQEPLPDANYFAACPDRNISNAALSMMIDTTKISDHWQEKGIYVPKPEDRILMNTMESVLTFKLKKVDQQIADINHQLRRATNEEELMSNVAKKNQLDKVRQQLGIALHRIIG